MSLKKIPVCSSRKVGEEGNNILGRRKAIHHNTGKEWGVKNHLVLCEVVYHLRLFNIIYIMRTNGKDGRIWRESLTLAVNWLLSTVIQNHPFLQTNQNQMSVSSK
ncbi:hypothetical protein CKY01_06895 [Photorhabdus laumondii subsp. clarkei]|uniref:Uncharacterized protein n=1 Tax=Photorhabdus laumondii subsp. clarkei TaxID=2029685 RepID=A0A329VI57_9GAMM|nr:hypothetical protein CKY01_06895 [Photorhabdus laumondii subsp. clarkei]